MLQDVFDQQPQLQIDDISSPISAQIFDFCDPDLFSETLQNSEVTSCSVGCYEDNSSSLPSEINNSYQVNNNNDANKKTVCDCIAISKNIFCGCPNTNNNKATAASATTPNINNNNNNSNNLSIIFDLQDDIDNDISASIDFSPSPPFSVPQFLCAQQFQFDFSSSSMQQPNPIPISEAVNAEGLSVSQYTTEPINPLLGPSIFDKDCLSSVPSYVPINPSSPSCSFLGHYLPVSGTMTAALSADDTGIFSSSILTGSELQLQKLDFQGDNNGIFCPDSLQRVFNPRDLQALGCESPQMVGGAASSTPLASEISLEDSNFKVGKLSVEQRKEKIHRYMKKRNERNFSKKIKYACRKTLADSRPRVRGRFAKNDDFGETIRTTCSTHEEDDYDELVVKEEDEMIDSSDIFGRINDVNSFKFNHPIQSWT